MLMNRLWKKVSVPFFSDFSVLKGLEKIEILELTKNQIENLFPLIDINNFKSLKRVNLGGNPLTVDAKENQIPLIEKRGIEVIYFE